jgi:hypothetical protein
MNRPARVRSIDVLDLFASAIGTFGSEANVALDQLRMDLQRAIQWIQYDQKEHWVHELRLAEQAVTDAKLELERRRMFHMDGQRPSCREQEKALEAAKRRVAAARLKLEAVKRWSRLLEHEAMECRSGVAALAQWLQTDVPRAVTSLRRMSGALESYVGQASSQDASAEPAASSGPESEAEAVAGGEAIQPPAAPAAGDRAVREPELAKES